MEKVLIKKSIDINAPREKIWHVLTDDALLRDWYNAFQAGSYAETDWKEGSKVIFRDSEGNGMIGKIAVNKPYEIISTEFQGMLVNGKEDTESQEANNIKGYFETYRISGTSNNNRLDIELDTSDEYADMFNNMWDKALQRIKELAENNNIQH